MKGGVVRCVVRAEEKRGQREKDQAFGKRGGRAVAARGTEGAASPLLIRLFGLFEARLGSEPLPALRTRKGLGLLALLTLHHGRPIDREWLAGTLWPSSPEPQALYNLRRSLSDLRRTLGAQAYRLQVTPPHSLSLELTGAEVDVVTFDEALARGDEPALASAVALYRGPLLDGWADEWTVQERARREQSYLAALDQLAASATARSDHSTAARLLRQAIAADPFRERSQRALMEALAAGGDTAAAILVYRELRVLLHREVNAEPSPETQALFERLRSEVRRRDLRDGTRSAGPAPPVPVESQPSGFAPAVAPGGNLPQPLSTFVGRERELLDVASYLTDARLVTLTGPGGIGKTRLAIRVAAECARGYADGAWFVDLAPLTDPALVPQTVGRALRVPETPGRPLTETLREALGARQLLLVLDNCEHLIDACACLADALLAACPHLRMLATSRQPLGLTGETAWPVPPLSLPAPESVGHAPHPASRRSTGRDPEQWPLDALLEAEAVRLFVDRARHAAPGFMLTPSSAPAALQICRRLDGIPLAIELAAARLKVLSIEQIAARLDDRFRLLTGGSRAALPRQQTLRATLDWSYDLLADPERILLRRLSVFSGGFTLEAAEAVCSGVQAFRRSSVQEELSPNARTPERLNTADVLDLLTQLVDRSLVQVERREGAARYALLETTREYARGHLREAEEEEQQRARHAQFFLTLAERAGPELRGSAQAQWLQRLEEEHDNCRAAIETFQARGAVEEGLRMGGVLGWFWWMRGYLWEGRERLQALLAQSGCEIRTSVPGKAVRLPGPIRDADPADLHQPGVRLAQAVALNAAGMLADDQGDYEAARALLQESLALSRELGDQRGAAMALNNLGGQAQHVRDFAAARALYEESLAIWHEIGDAWWTAAVLTNLGRVALHAGEYALVPALVESALAIQRQLQDKRAIARSLTTLGTTAARLGDYEAAHALHAESLSIVRELGAKQAIEETLCTLGSIASERGDQDAALAFHEERLAIARDMGSTWGMAHSLYFLGLLASDRGEGCRAAALWSESLALSQRLGDGERIAECMEGFASLAAPPSRCPCGRDPSSGAEEHLRGSQRAARLFGAAAALRERFGTPVEPRYRAEYDQRIDAARTVLHEAAFATAWAQGSTMTVDQAISLALSPPESP
jgi:predicted ATPase/DNA-binding SARP family transcriptional activator